MSMIMAYSPAAVAATIADGVPTYTDADIWTGSAIIVLVLAALAIWVLLSGRGSGPTGRSAPGHARSPARRR